MFLKFDHGIQYTEHEEGSVFPSNLEFIDFSTPVKSVNGPLSGPTIVATFLESIHFRNDNAKKMKASDIESLTNIALQKDIELQSKTEGFIASGDGYVTLKSYIDAIKENGHIIDGDVFYF